MEYPSSDPPPIKFAPPSNMTTPFSFSQPFVNFPTHNHPSYEEMIRRAIMGLNEKDGSSRQKIAKYIENEFHLPPSPTHNSELTHHLKKMKTFGQLVLVRHSYMLPLAPPQPPPLGPSVQQPPYTVSDGPAKLQPIVGTSAVTPSPTPSPSPPVGFAAFSPKQLGLGVPTTNLFGRLTPAAYQFGAAPLTNVSTMGLVTGPVHNTSTKVTVSNAVPTMTLASGPMSNVPGPVSGPINNVPAMGLVSGSVNNFPSTAPVSGPMNNVPAMGLVSGSVSNVSLMGPVSNSGPVFDPGALAKVMPSEQIDESAGVESKVDSVMLGAGLESSAGPLVVSAAKDPAVARNNDGPVLVVSAGPDLVGQNNDGPPTVLGKRGRGRPPKINGGTKKVWAKPAMYVGKGRRGRLKNVAKFSLSLRPRGRPRKNAGGAIVADGAIVSVDGANGGGGGVLPVAKVPWELHDRSLGRPNKDVADAASLTSEIHLMAYQGLKARIQHYQTRIKSAVSAIKPYLNETAVIALGALQDLEDLINMDLISVPINAQSAPAYVQSTPVDDLNPPVNFQGAPVDYLNTPINVQDAATENIQTVPSTAEDTQLTFQGTPSVAETAQLNFQSATVPVQGQQEPPLQS